MYGSPASGKDTITHALTSRSARYQLFPRIKCGPGRAVGYRMLSEDELAMLRAMPDEILWENRRYDSLYAIDRTQLEAMIRAGALPVIHLGQPEAVDAVMSGLSDSGLVVELSCPRRIAIQRMEARRTGDTPARIAAYDSTPTLEHPDVRLDTSVLSPTEAAGIIDQAVENRRSTA